MLEGKRPGSEEIFWKVYQEISDLSRKQEQAIERGNRKGIPGFLDRLIRGKPTVHTYRIPDDVRQDLITFAANLGIQRHLDEGRLDLARKDRALFKEHLESQRLSPGGLTQIPED